MLRKHASSKNEQILKELSKTGANKRCVDCNIAVRMHTYGANLISVVFACALLPHFFQRALGNSIYNHKFWSIRLRDVQWCAVSSLSRARITMGRMS